VVSAVIFSQNNKAGAYTNKGIGLRRDESYRRAGWE